MHPMPSLLPLTSSHNLGHWQNIYVRTSYNNLHPLSATLQDDQQLGQGISLYQALPSSRDSLPSKVSNFSTFTMDACNLTYHDSLGRSYATSQSRIPNIPRCCYPPPLFQIRMGFTCGDPVVSTSEGQPSNGLIICLL